MSRFVVCCQPVHHYAKYWIGWSEREGTREEMNARISLSKTSKTLRVHPITVLRWVRSGSVASVVLKKDHRGRYVFTTAEIKQLQAYKKALNPVK